ncbi:hypothetical protein SARC_12164 [Sphaeroforma arctica JP610]|uniref:Uncharacterized protein n=1 Tax=Sphaeroforma arctica JP610 TaxID=667725 RepID=A0A0L0FEV5_9EUKA|nr:hypothetical protein SARC_12164 [Sphaeroforma arctica JP610]KNC75309.1 hypothetical protein SARC_12164 [Sphaeroforma arctica JP610]|eukprot:XP_014149211.1 hypothetical protein SARC_12164 [Sphaeroforma arctica JP610]
MKRFIAMLTAAVLLTWSFIASLVGLVSFHWWSGPGGFQLGIASNCQEFAESDVNGLTFNKCVHYNIGAYSNSTETWMAGLLIVSILNGGICLLIMLFKTIFIFCCYNLAGPSTATFTVIQALLIVTVCILVGKNYGFEYPEGADSLGATYYIVISAAVGSMCAAALTGVDTINNRREKMTKKSSTAQGVEQPPMNITNVSNAPSNMPQRYTGGNKEKKLQDIYAVYILRLQDIIVPIDSNAIFTVTS